MSSERICVVCGTVFTRKTRKDRPEQKVFFCSKKCVAAAKRSGGVLRVKTEETNLKKYGSKDLIKIKLKDYLVKHHVENVSQLNFVREKVKKTCKEKYGFENLLSAPFIINKRKLTNLTKYGVENFVQTEDFLEKAKITNNLKLGCDWPLQSATVKSKIDFSKNAKKRHQTMKKNFSYFSSKKEDEFYEFLCNHFIDLRRHVLTENWDVDFYIKDIDVYVQFDGVYWHGLDRPLDEIKLFKSPRDKIILSTINRDQIQNKIFNILNLKLVRVTDKEFEEVQRDNTLNSLVDKIKRNNRNRNTENGN